MKRRAFLVALGGAAAMPLAVRAQQGVMPVIGMLHSQTQSSEATRISAIEQGLREVGLWWVGTLQLSTGSPTATTTACRR